MVAPIVGPVTTTDYLSWPPPWGGLTVWYETKSRYRQQRPYNVPLPYFKETALSMRLSGAENGTLSADDTMSAHINGSQALSWAKIKAWDRFVDSATETASLGETLAEMKSSGSMLTARVLQFTAFVKHLKRFQFSEARDVLGLPRKSTRDVWSRDRTTAQMIMEVQYGWRPLFRDLSNAVDVLGRGFDPVRASGRAKDFSTKVVSGGPFSPNSISNHKCRVQYRALIEVSNPNLALFSALGLTNPFGTLLALVPYSFVLDWFTNCQQALAGYNRFMGLTITNPSTSIKTELQYDTNWNNYGWAHRVSGTSFRRTTDLKLPGFTVKPFRGWSPERALNAISLLVLQLPKRAEDRAVHLKKVSLPFNWDTGRKVPGWKVPR